VIRPNKNSPSKQLSELGPWVVAQIYKASKLAFFNILEIVIEDSDYETV